MSAMDETSKGGAGVIGSSKGASVTRRLLALGMLVGLVASCGSGAGARRAVGWRGIDARLDRRLRTDGLGGAALIVRRQDHDVYRRSYGAYNAATPLPMASASKWLTAALVMTLVDSGRLKLDQPVAAYEPKLRGPIAAVTMRQLLSNTHGLANAPNCVLSSSVPAAHCDAQLVAMHVLARPGSRFSYGPTGYTLAGRIVELLTGQSFEVAFQTRIAHPLGMFHTSFTATFDGERSIAVDPAAGVVSTAADYIRFEQMLASTGSLDSTRVLSPSSVDAMFTTATRGTQFKSDPVAAELPSVGYALGAWVEAVGPDQRAAVIDAAGAYGTYPWIDRRRNIYGVLVVFDPSNPGATGAVRHSHDDFTQVERTVRQ